MKLIPDSLIITKEEFMLLAANEGISCFLGFQEEIPVQWDRKKIYSHIANLAKDNLLTISEKEIAPCSYLKEILSVIKKSAQAVRISSKGCLLSDACIYLADKAVYIQASEKNASELCIQLLPTDQIWELIQDRFHLPETSIPMEVLQEFKQYEKGRTDFSVTPAWMNESVSAMAFDLLDISTKSIRSRLLLLEEGIYPILIFQTADGQEKTYYSQKQMKSWLSGMLGGNKHDFG